MQKWKYTVYNYTHQGIKKIKSKIVNIYNFTNVNDGMKCSISILNVPVFVYSIVY